MRAFFLVFVGGALGTMWRFWWSGLIAQKIGESFPFGTLIVNVTGSFLIGLAANTTARIASPEMRQAGIEFLMFGICGGLTTFSSLSLQTFTLLRAKRVDLATMNVFFSTLLCVFSVWTGWTLGTLIPISPIIK
ncbi:MAG: fluoride efflux transporter CrcB [Verrucomicrobia bacterium]|nr:fluoride efflux transporter CrcB [Verrucomicrobiota bacterium]